MIFISGKESPKTNRRNHNSKLWRDNKKWSTVLAGLPVNVAGRKFFGQSIWNLIPMKENKISI